MELVVKHLGRLMRTMSDQPITIQQENLEIAVSHYTVLPGAILPMHRHQFPRFGYILRGELTVTHTGTNTSHRLKEGGFAVESIGEWHEGENTGSLPLEILVIDLMPAGAANLEAGSTITMKKSDFTSEDPWNDRTS